MEKQHLGVLTGSPITDMKITLVAGRAHVKHTEGGDFRQATYRAVRQGLMQAESVLLEPWYDSASGGAARTMWAGPCLISSGWARNSNPPETKGDTAVLAGHGFGLRLRRLSPGNHRLYPWIGADFSDGLRLCPLP